MTTQGVAAFRAAPSSVSSGWRTARVAVWCGLASALALSLSCNARDPLLDAPVNPTGPSGQVPASPTSALFAVAFAPRGLNGGGTATGTTTLTLPAPAGGLPLTLSSDDPAVAVPATIVVPQGATQTSFTVSTQSIASDRQVRITGSAGGRSASTTLAVWAMLPTSFSWESDTGDWVGGGDFGRQVPPATSVTASCTDSALDIRLQTGTETWNVDIAAPRNTPLRAGTYENAMRAAFRDPGRPGLDVSGRSRGCNTVSGRFVVHDIDLSPMGDVRRLWATFEQRCEGRGPVLRGEIRLTNAPRPGYTYSCRVN